MLLSVDLAPRNSAAVALDSGSKVIFQYDSLNATLLEFLNELGQSALNPFIEIVLLEDMPHGSSFRFDVKESCRMQGMVLKQLIDLDMSNKVLFVQPNKWKSYHKVPSRNKERQAREIAKALGYEPPDLHSHLHLQERTKARKIETDYIDAYLMGRWALDQINSGTDLKDIKSVSRYELGDKQWPVKSR